MYTIEVYDVHTAKTQAYVDEKNKAYPVKPKTQNVRKISTQHNLSLQEHYATNCLVGAVEKIGSLLECDYAQSRDYQRNSGSLEGLIDFAAHHVFIQLSKMVH